MLNFWASKSLALSLLYHGCFTFLLDSSTVRPNGENHYLTTSQYVQLMNTLTEEKQARHQMEKIVATLQTKVAILEQNYSRLLNENIAIQIDSHKLNQEVESLKQVKNLDVANGLQETQNAINMLKASNQARSEDFRALYNLTMQNNKDISIAEKQLASIYNGSIIDTKMKHLNDKMTMMEISQNLSLTNVNTTVLNLSTKGFIIDTKIKDLNHKIVRLDISQNLTSKFVNTTVQTLTTKDSMIEKNMANLDRRINYLSTSQMSISNKLNAIVSDHSQRVGFTSCGGSILSGGRLNFPLVKSSHGIYVPSYYRDGKFSPNKAGFYLLLANILSSNQGGYYVRKNGQEIARSWSHYSDSDHTARFSAPISAFMQLSVYDVITIDGASADFSSCLTIVQL